MPKKKIFSDELVMKIITMKHKGYKMSEIADKFHLTTKQVDNICTRNRLAEKKKATTLPLITQDAPSFPAEIVVDDVQIGTIAPMKEYVQGLQDKMDDQKPEKKEKTLDDFKPIEMIKYLYNKGYRIENNGLYCLIKKPVCLSEIVGV